MVVVVVELAEMVVAVLASTVLALLQMPKTQQKILVGAAEQTMITLPLMKTTQVACTSGCGCGASISIEALYATPLLASPLSHQLLRHTHPHHRRHHHHHHQQQQW